MATYENRQIPDWLNVDTIVDASLVEDLSTIRAEAEALAPTVRDFAIRAFRATQSFDSALSKANLPDEVWELLKYSCGAEATFQALTRLVDDLEVARLEKPDGDWPDWYAEEAEGLPQTAFTKGAGE